VVAAVLSFRTPRSGDPESRGTLRISSGFRVRAFGAPRNDRDKKDTG